MNAATQTISKTGIQNRPRLVTNEAGKKSVFKKIRRTLGKLFSPSVGQSLDYETWRDLEFRNEREPERRPPVHLNRWL